ncbi:MAG: HEAT repeat domain-containing protein [Methanotrichaceae archaeon]|nr:HEAT repeat domain-containing protein [Methanotrichaceae archaeon]
MEEEKKPEIPKPIITRSMAEEVSTCSTCGIEEPEMPEVLPDASWSTEKLIETLKDKHMLVRANAVMLLANRDPSQVLEPLIQMLKDSEYIVKTNAMVVIAGFGHQVFDRMLQALDDPDGDIRAGAAWVLGELKDPRAIEPLEVAARNDYPLARIQAKASLMTLGKGSKKENDRTETVGELKEQ